MIELICIKAIGRHQIDGVSQRPQQEAAFKGKGAQPRGDVGKIAGVRCDQVDGGDGAQAAWAGEGGMRGERFESLCHALAERCNPAQHILLPPDGEIGCGGGAGDGIGRIAARMIEEAGAVCGLVRVEDARCGEGSGERDCAAGDPLRHRHDVGHHAGLFAGEEGAGAAPAGHDLVRDEEDVVAGADRRHVAQDGGRVDQHAPGAQDQGLHDEGGRPLRAGGLQRVERRLFLALMGKGDGVDIEQQRRPGGVIDAAFAHRHGADGIAMIAVLEDEDAVARLGKTVQRAVVPVAERHFQRHLDRGRATVGEEDMGERIATGSLGRQFDQSARHLFRRFMGVAGEDKLVEPPRLLSDRRGDAGIAMAVRRHPPAGYAVDQRAAIGQMQQGPLRPVDEGDRLFQAMLEKGVPDRGGHGRCLEPFRAGRKGSVSRCGILVWPAPQVSLKMLRGR